MNCLNHLIILRQTGGFGLFVISAECPEVRPSSRRRWRSPFWFTLFTGVVSLGQYIGYDIGLNNAAGTAALAAATQADLGSSGNPTTGAVNAVNAEQGVSNWVACGSPVTPSCVSVSAATQSTGGSTSVSVEQVTLHGAFTPVFSLLGVSLPVTVKATAGS